MEFWGKPESDPLEFLTGPENLKWFLEECWEKKHHLFKADERKRKALDGLFTCDSLDEVMKTQEGPKGDGPLRFGLDLNAATYVNGVRETPNGEVGDAKTVWKLFKKGATLQFIQPQRFDTKLQALCAGLESRVGCLVGCNAYLTPKGTQGLAPHHDDVELLVCQTQGSKTWRLHKPINNYPLPSQPSGNLSQEVAGDPIEEVTLNVGDVLYLPRGTVHQAMAQDETSVHLTISTYQRWSWGDITLTVLQHAMNGKEPSVGAPLSMREGLPIGFINSMGSLTETKESGTTHMKEFCKRLRNLADEMEEKDMLLKMAVDGMAEDVCMNRIPPLEDQLLNKGDSPTLDSIVKPRGAGLFRLMPVQSEDGEVDTGFVQLMSCLKNPVHTHMVAAQPEESDDELEEYPAGNNEECERGGACCGVDVVDDDNGKSPIEEAAPAGEHHDSDVSDDSHHVLVFEMKYAKAVQQILDAGEGGIQVSMLPLDSDTEKLNCVTILWEDGIIATLDSSQRKAKRMKQK